jgi:hypothetical protein
LVLQQCPTEEDRSPLLPPVRESIANVLAFAEIGRCEDLAVVLGMGDGFFDVVAVDCDLKCADSAELIRMARERLQKSKRFEFSDVRVWADAACEFIWAVEKGLCGRRVHVAGEGALAFRVALGLHDAGAHLLVGDAHMADTFAAVCHSRSKQKVQVVESPDAGMVDIIAGCGIKRPTVQSRHLDRLREQGSVYDIGIGNLPMETIARARVRALRLYRIDNRAGVASAIQSIFETDYLVNRMMGQVVLGGVSVAAGGILAEDRTVIVDDIRTPSCVLGVADGEGHLFREARDEEDRRRCRFVRNLLVRLPDAGHTDL